MKTKRIVNILLCAILCVAMILSAFGCGKKPDDPDTELRTYDITVWVSETPGVVELTRQQIAEFNKQNKEFNFNAIVNPMGEGEAATQVLNDVESAPDIYCFAQDQLARLVQAGALAKPSEAAVKVITENNDTGAVKAATSAGSIYCYPLTSDNGYFMYYDKSVVKEEHLGSLEAIIEDCRAAGRGFSYELENSAWYNAGFFFATGCKSEWTMDTSGKFTSVDDTFNSPEGVIALKGMQKVLKYEHYVNSSNTSDFAAANPSAVVISGAWGADAAKSALGENLGAAALPSFEVDGKSYHLGSYSGNKLIGVKPQTDAYKVTGLQQLALFLSNEECQKQRFEQFNWGPSNKKLQDSEAVKSDMLLNALAQQSVYAVPQGNIHGSWWDIAKAYATKAKTANTDAELTQALADYRSAIDVVLSFSPEELRAFTVIGSINGDGWDVDHVMVESPENTWISEEVFTLKGGEEFKCRQGKSWDVSFGADGGNFVVPADTTGKYKIQLVVTVDADGNAVAGEITLVAAE